MTPGARVLARVAVRRVVTAQGYPAFLTSAQMHPAVADLDALLTHTLLWHFHRFDCSQVNANVTSHFLLLQHSVFYETAIKSSTT